MSRIETIITKARQHLSDEAKERWTDDRLLSLVSDAQEDVVVHSELLKTTVVIPLIVGQAEYDLPTDCYRLLRASTNAHEIPMVSYTTMDENARREIYSEDTLDYWERDRGFIARSDFDNRQITWEDTTGSEIEAVIYDNRDPSKIRFYPIPDDGIATSEYTFENAGPIVFAGDEMLGVVTDIETDGASDYTFDSPYGVVTSLFDPFIDVEILEDTDGVVSQINETEGFVTVWYTQVPTELTDVLATLSIPRLYDKALRYYVVANAYADDHDTRSNEKSTKYTQMYAREFERASKFGETDGIRGPNHRTHYRNAFE